MGERKTKNRIFHAKHKKERAGKLMVQVLGMTVRSPKRKVVFGGNRKEEKGRGKGGEMVEHF